MSLETDRWVQLTREQATFFSKQIGAVREIAFSPVSLEAGIVPVHAGRFAFQIDANSKYAALAWPDPNERDTTCLVMSDPRSSSNCSGFARVTEYEDSFAIDGIGTALTYGAGDNLYGERLMLRNNMPDRQNSWTVGVEFFARALEKAKEIQNTTNPQAPPEIIGIEGNVSGRLFRSLSSIASNLAIAGTMNERKYFSEETYDLAHVLLKSAISSTARGEQAEQDAVIVGSNGMPAGVGFESERDGIVVVVRTDDFPDTIALANATRPTTRDERILLEQYYVQARGAGLDVMTLPSDASTPQVIANHVIANSRNRREEQNNNPMAPIGIINERALQGRILRLLNEAQSHA